MAGDVVGPSAEQIARRILILKTLVGATFFAQSRTILNAAMNGKTEEERVKRTDEWNARGDTLLLSLTADVVATEVSPREKAIVVGGIGGMTSAQQVACSWRVEAAQALMWALGMIDTLPPCDVTALKDLLKGVPTKEVSAFIAGARLRPAAEIEKARSVAELWHWRSRTRQLIERGEVLKANEKMAAKGIRTFDDVVRLAARKAATDGLFTAIEAEDFPVKGKAYRELTAQEWGQVRSITVERHFALNWLCGRAPGNRWDETPTGT